MAQVEHAEALTTLERVKQHAQIESEDYDAELTALINEVSARVETFLGRHVISRQWVHDGSAADNPRLDSYGGTELFLPEAPITAVSTLKVYPTHTALTEGYDEDFVVDASAGIIELVNGNCFYRGRQLVEITYTAGYLSSATAGQESWLFGMDQASADIRLAATIQTAWSFHQKQRQREGVASMTSEGVSVQYLTDAWVPEVRDMLEPHRRNRVTARH